MRRRDLVAAGAGAVALVRPATAAAQAAREAETLTSLLRVEDTSVFAYDYATPSLPLRAQRLARGLRAHEAAHREALANALAAMHWPLPRAPAALAQVEIPQVRAALEDGEPRSALIEVERLSEQVYRLGIARLREAKHIQLAATILAAEAAHLVAWRTVG